MKFPNFGIDIDLIRKAESSEYIESVLKEVYLAGAMAHVNERWRAKIGNNFHFVNLNPQMRPVDNKTDHYSDADNKYHSSGNYFQTTQDAKMMYDKILELMKS